jgi:putative ABC transport system ATP-binding protein
MIRLHQVSRSYDGERQVLRGVDLEVDPGEFLAVIGRSGCGKTTLLNIIGGLDTAYDGDAEVAGRSLRALGDRELSAYRSTAVGFVFQAYHLLDHLRVIENIELPAFFARSAGTARPAGSSGEASVRRRAEEILGRIGLGDRASARPGELSGGERQRLALGRALFHRPPLLLCDEPTGNLDRKTGGEVVALMREIHRDDHPTVVVATHDDAIAEAADRVLELDDGALL